MVEFKIGDVVHIDFDTPFIGTIYGFRESMNEQLAFITYTKDGKLWNTQVHLKYLTLVIDKEGSEKVQEWLSSK